MDVLTFKQASADLAATMDRVVDDRAPAAITRAEGEAVVLVALSEWSAIAKTLQLDS